MDLGGQASGVKTASSMQLRTREAMRSTRDWTSQSYSAQC
jgi:hypothetical protein